MKKRLWIILALAALIALLCCGTALAGSSGTCGPNVSWTLDDNGALYITGSGPMYSYSENRDSPFSWK